MQSLASYGSDSEGSSSPPQPSTSKAVPPPSSAPPVASTSQLNEKLIPPPPSVLNRLNSSNSLKNSPLLSGVVSTSNSNSNSRSGTPTPRKSRTRESSASPPPHARASAPESTKSKNADQPTGESRDGSPAVRGEGSEEMGVNLHSLAEFGIPPIPTGPCNPAVEAKLANFHSLLESRNLHFNDSLSSSKAFRNPRIYNKLVEFLAVEDETGNCWDKSIWDGSKIGRDGDAKRIAELQKLRSESKQAGQLSAQSSRSSINFSSAGTSSSSTTKASTGGIESRYRERDDRNASASGGAKRSRWDNGNGAVGSKRERSKSARRR
ncbi:hypothetical protein JCM5353_008535 [Sporobolomyces roseus]